MPKNENEEIAIVDFKIVSRTSKAKNDYKCIVAIDENGKEHFVAFVR